MNRDRDSLLLLCSQNDPSRVVTVSIVLMDSGNPASAVVTELLSAWSHGDSGALDRLTPLVYSELQQLARAQLRRERNNHTLDTSGLVHEAFLRLVDQNRVEWRERAQFFAVAARLMRRVLIDHARRRHAARRDARLRVTVTDVEAPQRPHNEDLLALDEALTRLAQLDPRQTQLVELRYFAGMTVSEAAEALGISPATVKREWTVARAWLRRELSARVTP